MSKATFTTSGALYMYTVCYNAKKAVPCAVLLIENMRSGEGGKVGAQIFSVRKISARPS